MFHRRGVTSIGVGIDISYHMVEGAQLAPAEAYHGEDLNGEEKFACNVDGFAGEEIFHCCHHHSGQQDKEEFVQRSRRRDETADVGVVEGID